MVSTSVDIVEVIDGTGSMMSLIDMVKKNALNFHTDLEEKLLEYQREIETLRVKVIVFRDLDYEGENAFEESRFFELPQENAEYEAFVKGIKADGGGDAPESAFEALSLAMNSDWNTSGDRKRHIICLWTDAPPKMIKGPNDIVEGLPGSMQEFKSWWCDPQMGKMDPLAKRMVVFAPECEGWNEIREEFPLMYFCPTKEDMGLSDIDFELVMKMLCGTITN